MPAEAAAGAALRRAAQRLHHRAAAAAAAAAAHDDAPLSAAAAAAAAAVALQQRLQQQHTHVWRQPWQLQQLQQQQPRTWRDEHAARLAAHRAASTSARVAAGDGGGGASPAAAAAAAAGSASHSHSHKHHHHHHGGGACDHHAHVVHGDGADDADGAGAAEAAAEAEARAAFEAQEQACWSCHDRHHRGGLVCRACDKIQPVDGSLTYFELLGYPAPDFDLDAAALERRYKLLQWQLHPDKNVTRGAEERTFGAAQATLVNQAYGVLRAPLARANYMLMLAGVPAGEHFEGTIADPELLMEVMEAREEVERETDQEALVRLHSANRARQDALVRQLSAAFGAGDLEAARQLVAQLTYWVRLEEALREKL